jgi:predicted small lipoprotein YifL
MKRFKVLATVSLILILLVSVTGCGLNRPGNIRKDIYTGTIEKVRIIDQSHKENKPLTKEQIEDISNFVMETSKKEDLTNEEKMVVSKLLDVTANYNKYINNQNEVALERYNKTIKELKEQLGIK